jgi:hypothetical protein
VKNIAIEERLIENRRTALTLNRLLTGAAAP